MRCPSHPSFQHLYLTGFNEPRAHDYSRRGNPTRDVVQRALAELEGGAGAAGRLIPACPRFTW
ncbi:PLP-dependent transferase [Escherichia coli]